MVFIATFNNISVIKWWSVLLVEETGVPRENNWPVASYWQILLHNVVSSTPRHERNSISNLLLPYDHDHDDPVHIFMFVFSIIPLGICYK
jgi:hypothetical protein